MRRNKPPQGGCSQRAERRAYSLMEHLMWTAITGYIMSYALIVLYTYHWLGPGEIVNYIFGF